MHFHGFALFGLGLALGCAARPQNTESSDSPPQNAHEHAVHPTGPNPAHDGQGHGHHRFDDAEKWAKHFDDPSRDEWQRPDAVLDFISLSPDATVADLGAGTGYFAVRLAARVPQGKVLANDIEPDMVRYLTERARRENISNFAAVLGTASSPGLDEPVDVAFMCNVFHHIEDRATYFTAVLQRMRTDGRLIVVDFKKDASPDAPGPPPRMRVAETSLVSELEALGWKQTRSDRESLPHQYIVELVPNP